MQIDIFEQGKPAILSIECTDEGRHVLSSDALSAPERQLLLLLDAPSDSNIKTVSYLLQKIDINTLADRGWISYQLSTKTQVGKSTAVINRHINVKFVNSVDKKSGGKRIKSFFDESIVKQGDSVISDATVDPAMYSDNDNLYSVPHDQVNTIIESKIQVAPNNTASSPKPLASSAIPSQNAPTSASANTPKLVAYEPVHDSFEYIMIAHSLMDE